ncbi:MAG: hypothetical protein PHC61_10905 [Chitinivibrionales bacterium]|nr:hypothetical protein [Chitinivibrionales bacterium]
MNNLLKIILYTIADQLRQKSFLVLLGISVLLVLTIRSCYGGSYNVNGRQLDNLTVAWQASRIAFQVICIGMFLMVAMLSMKIFGRDLADGSTVLFLSRPVVRWQYALGRVLGVWILSAGFMFVLHTTIFCITWAKTGGVIPGYLLASLVSSINILFIIVCVFLLTLYLPDFISALATLGIVIVGLVSEGGYLLMNNTAVQSMMPSAGAANPAFWRIIYPKIFMLQSYCGTLISKSEFTNLGPVHPALNVLLYICLLSALLILGFNKKEI